MPLSINEAQATCYGYFESNYTSHNATHRALHLCFNFKNSQVLSLRHNKSMQPALAMFNSRIRLK
jgi:hypothetical protein